MLDKIGIAFLELREPPPHGTYGNTDVPAGKSRHSACIQQSPLVLNSDYFYDNATEALAKDRADAISFRADVYDQSRFAGTVPGTGAELNPIDFTPSWYSQGAEGYVDYPTMDQNRETAA